MKLSPKIIFSIFLTTFTLFSTFFSVNTYALGVVRITNIDASGPSDGGVFGLVCVDGVSTGIQVDPGSTADIPNLTAGNRTIRIVDVDVYYNAWTAANFCTGPTTYPTVAESVVNVQDDRLTNIILNGGDQGNGVPYLIREVNNLGNTPSVGNSGIIPNGFAICVNGILLSAATINIPPGTYSVSIYSNGDGSALTQFGGSCVTAQTYWPATNVTVTADEYVNLDGLNTSPNTAFNFAPARSLDLDNIYTIVDETHPDISQPTLIEPSNGNDGSITFPLQGTAPFTLLNGATLSLSDAQGNPIAMALNCEVVGAGADFLTCTIPGSLTAGTYTVNALNLGGGILPVAIANLAFTVPLTSANNGGGGGVLPLIRTGGAD